MRANNAAAMARVDTAAALAWRDDMVSNYSDAGQRRWLADRGIALIRGRGRLNGYGVVEVDGACYAADHIVIATARNQHLRSAHTFRFTLLNDTIQPFPTFSEIYLVALNSLQRVIVDGR